MREDFDWAVAEATAKKKRDFSMVELLTIEEGLWCPVFARGRL